MPPGASNYSRRAFLGTGLAAAVAAQDSGAEAPDLRKLIAASDLIYDKPVPRSEEGMPVGNGRMGSLVWTTASELRFQINRPDVYANNCASNSFFERHNDYCGGCGFVEPSQNFGVHALVGRRDVELGHPCPERPKFRQIVIDR